MPRNLVVLLDGTSNTISDKRTNILRLYGVLERSDQQIVYYDPGVGTLGNESAWSYLKRRVEVFWGLAAGWGMHDKVKDAYRFICRNFRKGETNAGDDRIFILGFSRGAYSARVLAGFIHAVGIMREDQFNLIDHAYNAYKSIPYDEAHPGEKAPVEGDLFAIPSMQLYDKTIRAHRPSIRFLGLFDSVASVFNDTARFINLQTCPFTHHNPSVEIVRHAVSLDERRTMFNPELWSCDEEYWGGPYRPKNPGRQDAREVRFAGSHCDIGGGLAEQHSGLAKVALDWLLGSFATAGLRYSQDAADFLIDGKGEKNSHIPPGPLAGRYRSMRRLWPILEFIPQFRRPQTSFRCPKKGRFYMGLFDHRLVPEGAELHQSVRERMDHLGERRPNMPASCTWVDK